MAGQRTGFETARLWQDGRVGQGFENLTAVVLDRRFEGEADLKLRALVRGHGVIWINVPGARKGSTRFGGAIEPLVWGIYQLRHSSRAAYLQDVEVKQDFWVLRTRPLALQTGLKWARLLAERLLSGFDHDDVMTTFYWSLVALADGLTPAWASARFFWRWLDHWGLAPDFSPQSGVRLPEGLVKDSTAVLAFLSAPKVLPGLVRGLDGTALAQQLETGLRDGM